MRQRILKQVSILVIVSVFFTFVAASMIMYGELNRLMKQGVRDELEFLRAGIEVLGEEYVFRTDGNLTASRITLVSSDGDVIFDSLVESSEMENHSNRPEFEEAEENGYGETVRFSETLSKQTFYYAIKLESGNYLRVAKTTDSVFSMMFVSFMVFGGIILIILVFAVYLVRKQTKILIAPINSLDLENPLSNVCYEELRPLLMRVDQQNKKIALQVEELKAAESVRREFSANVSHELKTPLMSISGYAELMMNGMVSDEKVPEFSGRIYHEASRLSNLVADIIQLSKLDEKSSDLPFEKVDLYELMEDVIYHLQNSAVKKNISLEFTGNSIQIDGVRHVLYEMMFNLAENAVKYTEPGGKVKIFTGERNGKLCYSVEDNGIGIPKEEQKRVFERFYRVDKSHSRQTGGTGLGLSIVKHGAMLHNAEINIESELGKGTKMELIF